VVLITEEAKTDEPSTDEPKTEEPKTEEPRIMERPAEGTSTSIEQTSVKTMNTNSNLASFRSIIIQFILLQVYKLYTYLKYLSGLYLLYYPAFLTFDDQRYYPDGEAIQTQDKEYQTHPEVPYGPPSLPIEITQIQLPHQNTRTS
jgi:hypothetical protein